jgi:hypothetical protein
MEMGMGQLFALHFQAAGPPVCDARVRREWIFLADGSAMAIHRPCQGNDRGGNHRPIWVWMPFMALKSNVQMEWNIPLLDYYSFARI